MPFPPDSMDHRIKTFVSRVGGRPATRATYTTILSNLARYTGELGIDDADAAIEFVTRARCARTRNLYLVVINQYRRSMGLPVLGISRERPQRKQFNTTRIAEIFDIMLPRCRVERDRALLALLRYGGLRISEAITLRVQDISFPAGQLCVSISQSKTTPRDPLAWRATRHLREYIDRMPSQPDGWLFPTLHGHISRRTVESWVQRLSTSCGYRIAPHDLRRLCATEMAEKFGPRVLMDYFGWSSLATAEIYIDKARGSSTQAIMSELGISNKSDLFTTETCWRCGTKNATGQVHCGTCGERLDPGSVPMRDTIDTLDERGLEEMLVAILRKRGILPPGSST